jgi:cytochrome P450
VSTTVTETAPARPAKSERRELSEATALRTLETLRRFRSDPLPLFGDIAREPDGIAHMKLMSHEVVVLSRAEHVHYILQTNHPNYNKDVPIFNSAKPIFGNGLNIAHGGEDWLRQRRLMQPAFHKNNVAVVTEFTEAYTADLVESWRKHADDESAMNIAQAMTRLTMRIVCRTLFGTDVRDSTEGIAKQFEQVGLLAMDWLTMPFPPLSVPTRRNRRFRAAIAGIDRAIADVIESRRESRAKHNDLLALLMSATSDDSGQGMSTQQLRDEMVSLLFAGHETLANTLSFCWSVLAQNPQIAAALHDELDSVLDGRPAGRADLDQLVYTRRVLLETMRLYPVAWMLMRKALAEDEIGGYRIPAGSYVAWSQWVLHRDPELWPNPERFDPERFGPEASAQRPRYAFMPFGEGPRACIGAEFAMAEGTLILANLAQHYRVAPVPGRPLELNPLLSLGPRDGVWVKLRTW